MKSAKDIALKIVQDWYKLHPFKNYREELELAIEKAIDERAAQSKEAVIQKIDDHKPPEEIAREIIFTIAKRESEEWASGMDGYELDRINIETIAKAIREDRERTKEACAKFIDTEWAPAYAEDLFTPVPSRNDQTPEQSNLITRASCQMGNHLCKRIAAGLRALDLSGGKDGEK